MVDDKPDDNASSRATGPDGGRAKRPGPTIEVEATRVTRDGDAAAKPTGDKQAGSTSASDKPAAGKPDASSAARESSASSSASVPPSAVKPAIGAVPGATAGAASASSASAASASSTSSAKPDPKPSDRGVVPPPPAGISPVVAGTVGAISGAIAAAVLFGIGASSGWFDRSPPSPLATLPPEVRSADLAALADRLGKIEARPAAPVQTQAAVPDPAVATRIDELEKLVGTLRDGLATAQAEANSAKAEASTAKTAVDGLKAAPGPAPVDLSGITARLGAIERTTATLKTATEQQRDKPLDDAPLRRVVAVAMLDDAVRDGEPFADAFAAMRFLITDQETLKPLEPFATTGVPLRGKMLRDLQSLLPQLTSSAPPVPADASWLDRLQAGALRLVKIQRTDGDVSGAQVAAVSRLAAAVKRNDLSGARKEIDGLAPADKAKVQAWADLYDARRAALAASQKLAAEASASLSKPAQ